MLAIGSACADERPETAHAVEIARAHAEDVGAFERWASRIAASDTSFPDRASLEEAAFSQVRREDRIAAAWIERRGPDPHLLSHPRAARVPDELAWRRVRAEGVPEVEIAVRDDRDYVRRTVRAPGGAQLVLTMAFVRAPAP